MDSTQRREAVFNHIKNSETAISARSLSQIYSVSRQIIVGDVALLRAEGHDIIATGKGYIYGNPYPGRIKKIIAVQHTPEETQAELELFVQMGVVVQDVIVEHPVYGEIRGNLNIQSLEDVYNFMDHDTHLLSSLTDGIHLHTILVDDDKQFLEVIEAMKIHNDYIDENKVT